MWDVIDNLWDHTLRGGMESIQNQRNTIETYFRTIPSSPNGSFDWNGVNFELIQTIHVVDDRRIVPSAGLRFKTEKGRNVLITGDTQHAPNQIMSYYQDADVIFQDCEMLEYSGSIHAQLHELNNLPEDIKVKMWLIHHNNSVSNKEAEEMGFLGLVTSGQEFDL